MANKGHLAILKKGVEFWNKWREENPDVRPDLIGADLHGDILDKANLVEVNLREANLVGVDLIEADLRKVNLIGANLAQAVLIEANLIGANLCGANLRKANLRRADLRKVNLSRANLSEANLRRANLSEADLRRTNLVETDISSAILTGCSVYGISAWNVKSEGAKQSELVITLENEPMIKVDNLEVAQFIYLLLKHEKLRDVLNAVTEKGVLILGRFGDGGLEVLQAIAEKLRELGYLPMLFDFERPDSRNYTETVKTMAGLSRFIIADLSGPSVPKELDATIPHFKVPFVPIIEKGRKIYTMFADHVEESRFASGQI